MPYDVPVGGVVEIGRRRPRRRYGEDVLAIGHFLIVDNQIADRTTEPDVGELAGGGVGRAVDAAAGLCGDGRCAFAGREVELGDGRGVDGEGDLGAVGGDGWLGFFGGVVGEGEDRAGAELEAVDAVAAVAAAVRGEDDVLPSGVKCGSRWS